MPGGRLHLRAPHRSPDHTALDSARLTAATRASDSLRRRFFVLREGTLLWFKSEADELPLGYLHLNQCAILEPDSSRNPPPRT